MEMMKSSVQCATSSLARISGIESQNSKRLKKTQLSAEAVSKHWWYAMYGLLALAITLLIKLLFVDFGLYERLMDINGWMQYMQGTKGLFLLFNLSTVASIISVPPLAVDVVMNVVAGAAFGTVTGTCVYVLGTSFGCCIVFQSLKFFIKPSLTAKSGYKAVHNPSTSSSAASSQQPTPATTPSKPGAKASPSSLTSPAVRSLSLSPFHKQADNGAHAQDDSKSADGPAKPQHHIYGIQYLEQYMDRAKRLSAAMKDDWTGLQITLLLRVSPITPLTICTALLALTELRFGPYLLGTVLGLVPASIPYCYLGQVGKAVHDNGIPTSLVDILGYTVGGLASVLVSYKIYQLSESVLENVDDPNGDEGERDTADLLPDSHDEQETFIGDAS